DIDWDLPRRLHRVSVEVNVGLGSNLSNLCDWLHDAGLVVGEHYCDQLRTRPDRALHIRGIHHAAAIHRNVGDFASRLITILVTILGEMLAGVEYGVMFDGR